MHFPPHDGYHQAESIMQELDLHDIVHVRVASHEGSDLRPHVATALGTQVHLDCAVAGLAPEDNLVFRALDAAEQACGVPAVAEGKMLIIEVEKHIPAGGGLGGGSSDAAAMLKAYAALTNIDTLDERLVEVARTLGADVAFFLYGGCALLGGRGDVFERALPPLPLPIVLMGDAEGMSTAAIYKAFDEDPQPVPDAAAIAASLEHAAPEDAARKCANNLGPIACAQSERLAARIKAAQEHPCTLNVLVSGSGSTSFAVCADEGSAKRFAADIAPLCDWVHISA